ncbi:GMP reductase [bacterium]|nr:GMP reductase [bacterium]
MRIERDIKLDYSDVLFRPKRSAMLSRGDVKLERSFQFKHSEKYYTGIPIIASNMHGVGTWDMAIELAKQNMFTCLVKEEDPAYFWDWLSNNPYKSDLVSHMAVSTGVTDVDEQRIDKTLNLNKSLEYVCIDVANGYSEGFLDFVKRFREKHPKITIIAGNVVTPDITEELILSGADIVKVGIGPGSVCTTRIKTGVGYPQLSAVIECADAAHGLGGHIIADGGCSSPGDVAKAFGAGADFVMLGGMLAGHDEGGGDVVNKFVETDELHYEVGAHLDHCKHKVKEKKFVEFHGMSSNSAQENNDVKNYRTSEGRVVQIPYKGPVARSVRDILGGLRSTCTYVGAKSLKELSKRTTFIQVSNSKQYNTVYESNTIGE